MYIKVAILIMLFVFIFDRKTLRIEWGSLAKFIAFLIMFVIAQIAVGSYIFNGFPRTNPIAEIPSWRLAVVFWEDAFYAIPLYYAFKIDKSKYQWMSILFAIFMSLWFGFGHLYQGVFGFIITSFYPYFISLKYGKRVGFGTVMCGHVLYDFAILFLARYGHYMY